MDVKGRKSSARRLIVNSLLETGFIRLNVALGTKKNLQLRHGSEGKK
jgi:hypothetical protein